MVNWIPEFPRALISYLVHSIFLTQSWVYKLTVNQHLLLNNGFGLSWSISSEFFFYLAYTLFVFAILALTGQPPASSLSCCMRPRSSGPCRSPSSTSTPCWCSSKATWRSFLSPKENQSSSFYYWFFYYSPYIRIWEFALGCLTAQLFLPPA